MLHDGDDRQAREVSHVPRTNHVVVSGPMVVYAGLCNLQEGATVLQQCQSPLTCLELAWRIGCISWDLERTEECSVK